MKKLILVLPLVFVLTSGTGCRTGYDGPYKGRVIGAETGLPIQGVVVLGVWYKEIPNPAGSSSTYYDARETVTDEKGDFYIPGMGPLILSTVRPMHVLIFKAGYEYIGMGPWEAFKVDRVFQEKIKWEGNRAIVPLKKLSREERERQMPPSEPPVEAPLRKVRLMLEEINKDLIARGVKPITMWGGKKL